MHIIKIEEVKNNTIVIHLPQELINKKVEIIISPIEEKRIQFKSLNAISLNTKNWTFDRDQSHER